MKSFKKTLKLLGLVILIVLACAGIGIGGTPVTPPNKKEDTIELKIELEELNDDNSKMAQVDIKQ
jgi:hypothetical protein